MKTLTLTFLICLLSMTLFAQDVVRVPGARQYGIETVQNFQELLLRDMPHYFNGVKRVAMFKDGIFVDSLKLTENFYSNGGIPVFLRLIKPRYANFISDRVCKSGSTSEQKGCALNIQRLTYQIPDDFYFFEFQGIAQHKDTLILKVDMEPDSLIAKMKFDSRGHINSFKSYMVSGPSRRYKYQNLKEQIEYTYDKTGNLIKKVSTYFDDYKKITESHTTQFDEDGYRINEVKNVYQYYNSDTKIFTTTLSFVYDADHRLIAEKYNNNDKFIINHSISYKGNHIDVYQSINSGSSKPTFSYSLFR